jgi:hypothetical protein
MYAWCDGFDENKRFDGFYWVKYRDEWIVARWIRQEIWVIPGAHAPFTDNCFDEIDERRIQRHGLPADTVALLDSESDYSALDNDGPAQ